MLPRWINIKRKRKKKDLNNCNTPTEEKKNLQRHIEIGPGYLYDYFSVILKFDATKSFSPSKTAFVVPALLAFLLSATDSQQSVE